MKLPSILAILALSLTSARAIDAESLLKNGLIRPETIISHQTELHLSAEQQKELREIMETAKPRAEELERAVQTALQKLESLLRNPDTKVDEAGAQLTTVLDNEADLKQLQLRVLVELRLLLTAEQRAKAIAAAGRRPNSAASLELRVRDEAGRMKKSFDDLALPLTDALKERGKAVEALIKDGDWESALKAMAQLVKDSGLDEPVRNESPDFAPLNPGNTDLGALGQRLEAVTGKVQKVISIPVLLQLMQAKEALDKAKSNSDADAAGKALTFAETLLNGR